MDYIKILILTYYCFMAKLTTKDIELKNKIKSRINLLLKEKGINQSELASLSLKDRQAINRWTNLNNTRGITIYTIGEICETFHINLKEFFDHPIFNTQ
ncbi:helix-turn-helix transcriptional regulator [Flavobacterium sp. JP2137]|uniref:helix-turn-helix transcriptional regulator n=1 Tax=Flavobacterium sp. JP2137 TaxID=3414510 RepID=UPI003D2FEE02